MRNLFGGLADRHLQHGRERDEAAVHLALLPNNGPTAAPSAPTDGSLGEGQR
jgi:hypothetical protein